MLYIKEGGLYTLITEKRRENGTYFHTPKTVYVYKTNSNVAFLLLVVPDNRHNELKTYVDVIIDIQIHPSSKKAWVICGNFIKLQGKLLQKPPMKFYGILNQELRESISAAVERNQSTRLRNVNIIREIREVPSTKNAKSQIKQMIIQETEPFAEPPRKPLSANADKSTGMCDHLGCTAEAKRKFGGNWYCFEHCRYNGFDSK